MPAAPLGRLSTFLLPALALLGRSSLWRGVEAPPSTGAPDRYLFIAIRPGMKAHRELIPYDREIATSGACVMRLVSGETYRITVRGINDAGRGREVVITHTAPGEHYESLSPGRSTSSWASLPWLTVAAA